MLSALVAADLSAAPEIGFNRDILPILSENCFACHGPDSAGRKAGLRLDRRETAIGETESGAHAIVPGKIKESELLTRINATDEDDVMPPVKTGKELTAREKEMLRRWIAEGAAYEKHWAFVPPVRTTPPAVAKMNHPIDQFIRARLQQEKVAPSPEAERTTLLRRLYLDLVGLPPTRAEVEEFVRDRRPDAYEQVVDRLLASPHFGEKWARWWLDLAHYGDSDGIRLDNARPNAWRYRQWVVDALNRDLRFDEFTVEQLAGDLLPKATADQVMATGFLRNTISDRQTGNADPALGRVRQTIDRASTVGTVWLGLSVGCAECHDHKFDPITQREFYQLYAFFNDADEANIDAPLPGEWEKYAPAKEAYDRKKSEILAPIAAELATLQATWEQKMVFAEANPGQDHAWGRALEILVTSWGRDKGEGQFEGLMIIKTPPAERSARQQERLQDYFLRNGQIVAPARFKELKVAALAKELDGLAKALPPLGRAQAMAHTPMPRATHIHTRGDFRRPGEEVEPGTPAVLPALAVTGRADRVALARWLVSPENPLTARVAVNRLWQELFGRGIVASSDNMGFRGASPSHPELLDWLATEFIGTGWSVKKMLRLMLNSQTYRQSANARTDIAARDPANTWLARQTRLRLSAEGVRDNALAASGLLNLAIGGPSVRPPQPKSLTDENTRNPWKEDKGSAVYRRGLYTFIQRLTPFAQFVTFDLPGSAQACTQRERSNTPLQALNLLNDPNFVAPAQALARRVWQEAPADNRARIEQAFYLTLARPPSARETEVLAAYLAEQQRLFAADKAAAEALMPVPLAGASPEESAAWAAAASVLLNLDEFITRP
jgi:hypothetical protein